MKKALFSALLLMGMPLMSISASTVSFSPSSISVTAGQMVNLPIYVNAGSDKAYTVKTVVTFPPEFLEVKNFSFASSWLPLSQPGYDSVNNASGSLTKTAGYAGGLSGSALFGTVTFYAKQSGTATVSVASGTQVLNASNQNTFTGGNGASVNIAQIPVPVTTPPPTPPKTVSPSNPSRTPMVSKTVEPPATTTSTTTEILADGTTTQATTSSQNATAYFGAEFAERNVSLWASLLAVIASFIMGYFVSKKTNE